MEFRGECRTTSWLLAFQSEVLPNRAALQPCLEGPALTSGETRLLAQNLERSVVVVVVAAVIAPAQR